MDNHGENDKSQADTTFSLAKKRLASHPDTSPEVLDKLADKGGSADLLERVAENPQTSEDTLKKLASNESEQVRSAVTENPNASIEAIAPLIIDEDPNVRFRIAENANTPLELLEQLIDDDNAYVAERAKQTISNLSKEKSVLEQADELLLKGQYELAEKRYCVLLEKLDPLIGGSHLEMASIRHKLAAALEGQGKTAEAVQSEQLAKTIKQAHERLPPFMVP